MNDSQKIEALYRELHELKIELNKPSITPDKERRVSNRIKRLMNTVWRLEKKARNG